MQQPHYLNDLQYIVESVDIEEDGKLHFRNLPYDSYDYPEASDEARLFHNLASLLYSSCYTRSSMVIQQDHVTFDEIDSFLPALRKANTSSEHYDCGWTVEEIEYGGNVLVRKGGNRRYTYAGDFIREHFVQGPLQRGEAINIRILPEYNPKQENVDTFYFVFGETLLDNNNSAIVRLYFNLKPEGAALILSFVSKGLNNYNIPFQYKCLNRPGLYNRCDAAVLYIDKRYFNIVVDLLWERYDLLQNWLKPDVPMFTRWLGPGIGFAENPFSSSESFGTSRCKIIAQGLVNAWKEKQPKNVWIEFIIQNIHLNYLLPETLYLNPNSKYPYQFPAFEN